MADLKKRTISVCLLSKLNRNLMLVMFFDIGVPEFALIKTVFFAKARRHRRRGPNAIHQEVRPENAMLTRLTDRFLILKDS